MEKSEFFEKIDTYFGKYLNLSCDIDKKEKLFVFMNMLIEKNKFMNLTAITDPEMIIIRHFVDSLMLLNINDFRDAVENAKKINQSETENKKEKANVNIEQENEKLKVNENEKEKSNENAKNGRFTEKINVVDVGTGAGFPGLPLAIMCPEVKFFLCDSLQKRINFLSDVIGEIGQKNAVVSHMRAEDAKFGTVYRENFTFAISRGVTKISTLSEYLMPYVKKTGKIVMYKMSDCENEFEEGKNAVKILGGKFLKKYEYSLFDDEPKRALLVFEKIKNTDKKYPRQGNKPKTNPL